MDLDAFVGAHAAEWERLKELTRRGRLTGAESDELLDLYQRTATHLSVIRSSAPDPTVVQYLSTILAKARNRASGTRTGGWQEVVDFFAVGFPAALYRSRWWWGSATIICVLAMFIIGWYVQANPAVQSAYLTPAQIDQLVNHDFANYYSENAAQDFAFRVWSNNAWIAALCIALGVLGVPVVYLLWTNVVNVALSGGIMVAHGRADVFFGLILPHGMLELTAVFVAAGLGLQIFWSWIEPGSRSRTDNLAATARSSVTGALGLAVVLLITGIIEAFVTPSPLPTWARIGIGLLAEILFLVYVFVVGRRAVLRGETGDLDEVDRGATAITV
ncbi:stage II sporulation protein M [Dermacoccaceae bacterium W4C1]